jgi:hypothetical protein
VATGLKLPKPVTPTGMTPVELHQAYRALAGKMLRQEIYAEDGSALAANPYLVTQESWEVKRLQPPGTAPFASFLAIRNDKLSLYYERDTSNPRIAHEIAVETDALGYVVKSATIGYPRTSGWTHTEQQQRWITTSQTTLIHQVDDTAWYRHGVPSSEKKWEMHSGLAPAATLFTASEIATAMSGYSEVAFEATLGSSQKRLLSYARTKYLKDDLTAPLAFGSLESRALLYESYAKALTSGMLGSSGALQNNVIGTMVTNEGGYKNLDADGSYDAATGTQAYDANAFFLVTSVTDVFGNSTSVTYDTHKVFVTKTTAPIVGDTHADIDYRVLAPKKVTDVNENFVEAAFDELGRVTKTAVESKGTNLGDTLTDPTTRFTYELGHTTPTGKLVPRVKSERRKTHGGTASWLTSYTYLDGTGREFMIKVQAEPGNAIQLDSNLHVVKSGGVPVYQSADPRWVGTGRQVFDNKGNLIKQFEPYFSPSSDYEDDADFAEWGVTPIIHHDPIGRVIRTDLPNGSYLPDELDVRLGAPRASSARRGRKRTTTRTTR